MTTQNYLIVESNIVTNVCLWDGNTETWTPPSNAIMLVQATAQTKIWALVNGQYELVDSIGDAGIGFTWNGSVCATNEPKPELPQAAADQPSSTGTQQL